MVYPRLNSIHQVGVQAAPEGQPDQQAQHRAQNRQNQLRWNACQGFPRRRALHHQQHSAGNQQSAADAYGNQTQQHCPIAWQQNRQCQHQTPAPCAAAEKQRYQQQRDRRR